jgi:predicted O-methyltransferase YrrM
MSIVNYLNKYNIISQEGNSYEIPEQRSRLQQLSSSIEIKTILEIGFNEGHSSDLFLSNSLATVTSFDINERECVKIGKEYIDIKYPSRHRLNIGDSTKTIPEFIQNNPEMKFDLIYIDGGHDYFVALADLINCKKLAHKDTIVLVDDIILQLDMHGGWTIGPSLVWAMGVGDGVITQMGYELYRPGRGMAWGKYNNIN